MNVSISSPRMTGLVIRPHALGNFRDLIHASVLSPAMLVYLDGKENKKPRPDSIPNENAARELLELHTLGVHGGYTQRDVYETARCLTGWTIQTGWQKGKENFDRALHDNGEKLVLGHKIPAGSFEKDLDKLLDIVCFHSSTARHIATKLVHKFVSDDPPPKLIDKLSGVFSRTRGDIKEMLLALFTSKEFADSKGEKLKRPFHFVISSLRMTGADTYAHEQLIEYVSRMGQGPFAYPTPDGYPDKPEPWLGTLLWRWNFASALVSNGIPSVEISPDKLLASIKGSEVTAAGKSELGESELSKHELSSNDLARIFGYFIGRSPNSHELQALQKFLTAERKASPNAEIIGLILASPAFQRC